MNKTPITLILPDIRSAMNIGAIFRTADAAGLEKIYLTGYSATPEHPKVVKTSIGAEKTVPWEYVSDTAAVITKLRKLGYQIISLEKNESSIPLTSLVAKFPIAIIVGNEISGVPSYLQAVSDQVVHLPMLGSKESLNVATASGIAIYNLLERHLLAS